MQKYLNEFQMVIAYLVHQDVHENYIILCYPAGT